MTMALGLTISKVDRGQRSEGVRSVGYHQPGVLLHDGCIWVISKMQYRTRYILLN